MATGKITVDEGTTTHLATNTLTEDAVTKHVNRSVLNNSSGTEIGTTSNPVHIADAGGTITVDGTVAVSSSGLPTGASTATKQDTGNTSVASIDTKTPALGQALAAASVPVVLTAAQITTLTPPAAITGFSTEATLSTLNGKVTACNTGAVVISGALPAGSAAIGKLAANSGVDIGDVDVTSVPADPFGVNADAASATGSISAKLRFIAGTGIPITGTVTVGSHAVTNAGTFAVQNNGHSKTILSTGGSASSSGNNTLVAAGTNRLKVFAFSLSTTSTTAMTCIFQSGAGGTELWRCILQAPTSVSTGANLSVAAPAWLFATASATLLNLNLSSANAVHWSVSYFDEA